MVYISADTIIYLHQQVPGSPTASGTYQSQTAISAEAHERATEGRTSMAGLYRGMARAYSFYS